jgi:hypothetical protein
MNRWHWTINNEDPQLREVTIDAVMRAAGFAPLVEIEAEATV